MTPIEILEIPMQENDAGAKTIREYLIKLLTVLWEEQEGFSGKRPFGNSGWDFELYEALVKAKAVDGKFDDDGYLEEVDTKTARRLISQAIETL